MAVLDFEAQNCPKMESVIITDLLREKMIRREHRTSIERVTDGKLDYFEGMATSGNVKQKGQYVEIDLGKVYTLDKVIVYWRAIAYSMEYMIMTSIDGTSWDRMAKKLNPAKKGYKSKSHRGDPIVIVETDARGDKARYIRVIVPKDSKRFSTHKEWNFVQIMEVKAYPVIE